MKKIKDIFKHTFTSKKHRLDGIVEEARQIWETTERLIDGFTKERAMLLAFQEKLIDVDKYQQALYIENTQAISCIETQQAEILGNLIDIEEELAKSLPASTEKLNVAGCEDSLAELKKKFSILNGILGNERINIRKARKSLEDAKIKDFPKAGSIFEKSISQPSPLAPWSPTPGFDRYRSQERTYFIFNPGVNCFVEVKASSPQMAFDVAKISTDYKFGEVITSNSAGIQPNLEGILNNEQGEMSVIAPLNFIGETKIAIPKAHYLFTGDDIIISAASTDTLKSNCFDLGTTSNKTGKLIWYHAIHEDVLYGEKGFFYKINSKTPQLFPAETIEKWKHACAADRIKHPTYYGY